MKKIINRISLFIIIAIFIAFVIFLLGINNDWFSLSETVSNAERLDVYILDVGDASSAVIKFADKTVVIDVGSSNSKNHVVDKLSELNIEKIDLLVLTHPHSDHYGGFRALKDIDVKTVYISPQTSDKSFYNDTLEFFKDKGSIIQTAPVGERVVLSGVSFAFCAPLVQNDDINDMSVVVKVDFEKTAILFPADMSAIEANQIIDSGYDLSSDVFIASHHGSNADGANSYRLLREIMPEYVIISSAGSQSNYGYPHEEVLSRLSDLGCEVYRTDLYGDIHFYTDGEMICF